MRCLLLLMALIMSACKTVGEDATGMRVCQPQSRAIADGDFEVEYIHHSPGSDTDRAVVIMPPTGGRTFLESRYASLFCESGFAVYVVEGWSGMSETSVELSIHNRLFGRAQRAIETIVGIAREQFVGLMGTSVGGLHAATAVGRLERISAAFVIAAGAPVVDVIVSTEQDALKSLRKRRMQVFGFEDREAYRHALAAEFHWEPLAFADAARDKPLGMVVVQGDTTVPTSRQAYLREIWRPDVAFSVSGFLLGAHAVGILQTWWHHADDILAFFRREADRAQD